MIKFKKEKLAKHLNILTLGCWTGIFLSVIFQDLNANALREIAGGSCFVVIIDLIFDMLGNRDKRIKRKIVLEYVVNESDDRQGEE